MVWKHLRHFFFQHPVKMFVTMSLFNAQKTKFLISFAWLGGLWVQQACLDKVESQVKN